ncbi:hypothetical protein ACXX81_04275 [Pseudomonas sp. GNP013]
MHKIFEDLVDELELIRDTLKGSIPSNEAFSLAHQNWAFPAITVPELQLRALAVIDKITERGGEVVKANEDLLAHYVLRLKFVRTSTIPQIWNNAGAGTWVYYCTLDALEVALEAALESTQQQDIDRSIQASTRQARSMEAKIIELTDRSQHLDQMVSRIESAHTAAEELPTDVHSLKEARSKVDSILRASDIDRDHISTARQGAEQLHAELQKYSETARDVLERCETAYASATSTGLAAAFSERSQKLDSSSIGWIVGLVASLLAGSLFGSIQLKRLADVVGESNTQGFTIAINLVLAILSVGGPIWFAWLSTKQIGQRFRLSEDYAFKASISRAYEGYRREASRIDPELERQLLGSALSRLDEQPLRLVETDSFGSPWHEVLSSDVMKDAMRAVPNFAAQLTSFASDSLSKARSPKQTPAVNSATPVVPPGETKSS